MAKQVRTAIEPTREENYPEWYQQVIKASDMAENSEVRGCMVIKPWGYSLWENIQRVLDDMFKETGHVNAYFPLFIPKRFFEQEAQHVEGFAKECAVVTHSRLEDDGEGGLKPGGKLGEELVVRPTSETIIGASFSKWVSSYRDLPILMNQWANVVRWEMRTRLFLRTAEFLWQEGHTVHATEEEAVEETRKMLDVYADFAENYMALPVVKGEKTETERFPGAVRTYSIEAMMQDRKALQAGTSHFLGQNFARASNIRFQNAEGEEVFAWTTSWGVSTRLIGALIMAHSDDDGLVLPPRIAPAHVAIIPIFRNDEEYAAVMDFVKPLVEKLRAVRYQERKLRIEVDARDMTGGERAWNWVKKGVPIRLEIGPRDIASNSVFMGRRDADAKQKQSVPVDAFVAGVVDTLEDIQQSIFRKAKDYAAEHTKNIDDTDAFYAFFTPENAENPEIHGGWANSHWCGSADCETKMKDDLKVTIRNIPLDAKDESGACIVCGKPSQRRVLMAKSY